MNWKQNYQDKLTNHETAVASIESGSRIAAPPASSFPLELINALSSREDLANVQFDSGLLMCPPDFMKPEQQGRIDYHSFFLGPLERFMRESVPITATSIHFSRLHEKFDKGSLDVTFLEVSPPDEQGYMSLGPMGTLAGRAMIRGRVG